MTQALSDTALRAGGTLHVDVAEDPAIRMVFSGRFDARGSAANLSLVVGEGDVLRARREALSLVDAQPQRAVFMRQVHGGDVAVVDESHGGRGAGDHDDAMADVDALVTHETDLALVVLVADCVPVLLADPGAGVAAVHAGRRGVERNIVAAAVAALTVEPSQVVAAIGPAIGGCCYEVPQAMADELAVVWPQARATTTWGAPALDLPAAVVAQLEASGVSRIARESTCTRCSDDRYFSHRATTNAGAAAGRQAGIVVRRGTGQLDAAPARPGSSASLDSPVPS